MCFWITAENIARFMDFVISPFTLEFRLVTLVLQQCWKRYLANPKLLFCGVEC